jgi:hypothetical protein
MNSSEDFSRETLEQIFKHVLFNGDLSPLFDQKEKMKMSDEFIATLQCKLREITSQVVERSWTFASSDYRMDERAPATKKDLSITLQQCYVEQAWKSLDLSLIEKKIKKK